MQNTALLLDEMSSELRLTGAEKPRYLRKMNGAALMLEIAGSLECGDDVVLDEEAQSSTQDIQCFQVLEILPVCDPLVDEKEITLDCEPRPLNYRLVDGGPDQKQSHLPTKNSSIH